jgi:hypothetical protein
MESIWSPCKVHVESRGVHPKKVNFPHHVESTWSPHGVQWSLCGVMESTWSLWGSVKYTHSAVSCIL